MEEVEISDQRNDIMFTETELFGAEFQLKFAEPELNNATEVMPQQNSEAQPRKHRKRKSKQMDDTALEMPIPISVAGPAVSRKMESPVWKYFTKIEENVVEGSSNPVVVKYMRAVCGCGKSLVYGKGSNNYGTGHLKRHIRGGSCSLNLNSLEAESQLSPATVPTPRVVTHPRTLPPRSGSYTPRRCRSQPSDVPFDADRRRSDISKLIIKQGYPLHMVEQRGFVSFLQNLHPQFDMVSFSDVEGDCLAAYLEQKQVVQKLIEAMPGKICLILDLWSSSRTIGYLFVTGQFYDSKWRIQRKLLNVIMEPFPDSPEAFSKAVAASLSNWNLNGKLFSVTINQPLRDPAIDDLKARLSDQGSLLVGKCLARSLAETVQTALTLAHDIVKKVRYSVKFVKYSESREKKITELKHKLQVPTLKCLSIDDQTKWNTTYEMLLSASELKEVFASFDTLDSDYQNCLKGEDWKQIEILCSYLKPLFLTANLLTTASPQEASTFFHEAWKIQIELARGVLSQDLFVRELTKSMHNEFDKYWKSCCFVLAIAVVMDPRFKLKLVEFNFLKIYGEEGNEYVKDVNEGIHEIFLDYLALPLPEEANGMEAKGDSDQKEKPCNGVGFMDFEKFVMNTMNQLSITELDEYLEDSLLPREGEFDLIGWWKMNRKKYPTLSKMALDILSVPVCTVPASSVFDTARKEMDNYRCDLQPKTLEALICAKEWIQ